MKMTFKVSGVGRVAAQLRQTGELSVDIARGRMKRAAERIKARAQLFVPEDTTALKNTIRVEKTYEGRGRLAIDIVAGNATVMMENGRIINLDQYAWIIHERYSQMKPGEGTRRKMAANPSITIGEGFMTRAYAEEEEKLAGAIVQAVTQVIKKVGL
jgi:hypothetical protein